VKILSNLFEKPSNLIRMVAMMKFDWDFVEDCKETFILAKNDEV